MDDIDLRGNEVKRIRETLVKFQQQWWSAFSSAYELTQFLRGTLFFKIVDILLTRDYRSPLDICAAHDFIKLFIKFEVAWLKWMADHSSAVREKLIDRS